MYHVEAFFEIYIYYHVSHVVSLLTKFVKNIIQGLSLAGLILRLFALDIREGIDMINNLIIQNQKLI